MEWEGHVEHTSSMQKSLPPATPNGGSAGLAISLPEIAGLERGHEVFFKVRVFLGRDEPWALKGHCVGEEQFAVPVSPLATSKSRGIDVDAFPPVDSGAFSVRMCKGQLQVVGSESLLAVSLTTGECAFRSPPDPRPITA